MIRRLPAAVATVIVAALVASGCSTFTKSRDAATISTTASSTSKCTGCTFSHTLSVKDFEAIAADLNPTAKQSGDIAGVEARSVIQRWILAGATTAYFAGKGLQVTDADRAAAAAALQSSQEGWSTYSAATQQLLVSERAPQAAEYNAGLRKSGTACLKYLTFSDPAKAAAAAQQLAAGTTIDAVAAANGQQNDVAADPTTQSECTPVGASTLPTALFNALLATPIGKPTDPVTVTSSTGPTTYIVLQRPYAEIAGSFNDVFTSQVTAGSQTIVGNSKIFVDSRYGMWDPTTGTVVATR